MLTQNTATTTAMANAVKHASKKPQVGSRLYSVVYPFPSIPRPKRNALYYNTFYYGSQLKNGIKGKIPPIRKFSQSYYHNQLNGSSTPNADARSKQQLIKFIALFSIGFIFYGMSVKLYYHGRVGKVEDEDEEEEENQIDVRPTHSWTFFCYSTLPLNALSRLWGQVNSIELPVWLRAPGYKFYAYCFGANLDEIKEKDLTKYKNLSEFFYRELEENARIINEDSDIVCPSDGKVISFGVIEDGNIEQVKGMTYSINALLGDATTTKLAAPSQKVEFHHADPASTHHHNESEIQKRHEEFAEINGISYTIDDILGGEGKNTPHLRKIIYKEEGDRADSISIDSKQINKVTKDLRSTTEGSDDKELFYAVIYLAPGDYHRYHSPTNWVVTLRRHFVGELYSVAPYFQRTLSNLFVLNERVSLLGYWKYGFMSMTPVGATNVGSIKVNFDKDLATNTKYESPHYKQFNKELEQELEQEEQMDENSRPVKVKKHTCYEATYGNASKTLGGYPVTKGEEVGGFMLGSTVVLVFEAPKEFKFHINSGEKVKLGQSLGTVSKE
jgi:phosphatidylserine decarboxylase